MLDIPKLRFRWNNADRVERLETLVDAGADTAEVHSAWDEMSVITRARLVLLSGLPKTFVSGKEPEEEPIV